MATMVLNLKCQKCGSAFGKQGWEEIEDNVIRCIASGHAHTLEGELIIPHTESINLKRGARITTGRRR